MLLQEKKSKTINFIKIFSFLTIFTVNHLLALIFEMKTISHHFHNQKYIYTKFFTMLHFYI